MMRKEIVVFIYLCLCTVALQAQVVSAEFDQLRLAINQSGASQSNKSDLVAWADFVQATLPPGQETIFATKLLDYLKCLVDQYLPDTDKDGATSWVLQPDRSRDSSRRQR